MMMMVMMMLTVMMNIKLWKHLDLPWSSKDVKKMHGGQLLVASCSYNRFDVL